MVDYVLELCPNGELLGQLKKSGSLDEKCAAFYAAEIVNALEALHSDGIIHRDLKVTVTIK
jgi:3-phosphoinositide dependent protein kinase-1